MIDGIGANSAMAARPTPSTAGAGQGQTANTNAQPATAVNNPIQGAANMQPSGQMTTQPAGGPTSVGPTQSVNPAQGTAETTAGSQPPGNTLSEIEEQAAEEAQDSAETLSADGTVSGGSNIGSQLSMLA